MQIIPVCLYTCVSFHYWVTYAELVLLFLWLSAVTFIFVEHLFFLIF